MALQLSDLDELNKRTRSISSRSHLNEAIISYRAGAFRASIITTWVSVCVDIIEKIRELSVSDDNAAKEIERRLDSIQPTDVKGMLDFENNILTVACEELELISHIEKSHLERLKKDRNICAHPTFSTDRDQFNPLPESTRSYIVQAANYLLINTPIKGKVVLENLFELASSESFPLEEDKAFTILSSDRYLGRVKPSTVRNLVIIFLKRLFKDEEAIDQDHFLKICAALGAISRLYNDVYTSTLEEKFNQILASASDNLLKRLFMFLPIRSESNNKLEDAIKVRLEGIVSTLTTHEIIDYKAIDILSIMPELQTPLELNIAEMGDAGVKKLCKEYPSIITLASAIEIFVNSGSFASAYSNGVNYLIPHANYIRNDDLELLLKGVSENETYGINQILHAGGIEDVLCKTYKITKENVVEYSNIWKDFWESIGEREQRYHDDLKLLLIEDSVIENS